MQTQDVAQEISDTVERWVEGKVDAKTFDDFIKRSNKTLDELKAAKAAEDDKWWKISTQFIEV